MASPLAVAQLVDPAFEYQFRMILIGNSMVGKSSLLKYFTEGRCPDVVEATVGVDFFSKIVEVEPGVRVKLQLWDTAGQERFRSITKTYYRNSVGVLMVYDITSRQSFEDMLRWLNEALQEKVRHSMFSMWTFFLASLETSQSASLNTVLVYLWMQQKHIDPSKAVFVVVGHKSDMDYERVITQADGERFAAANGLIFIETSAVTGENVELAFTLAAKQIYAMLKDGRLQVTEGWDGIKRGYGSEVPRGDFQIREEEARRDRCCS